jgi:hypothetical protein
MNFEIFKPKKLAKYWQMYFAQTTMYVLVSTKNNRALFFLERRRFFAANCQKSQIIVIITSTQGFLKLFNICSKGRLSNITRVCFGITKLLLTFRDLQIVSRKCTFPAWQRWHGIFDFVLIGCIGRQKNQGPMLGFFKYFHRKIQRKNWRFWLKPKLNYAKCWS